MPTVLEQHWYTLLSGQEDTFLHIEMYTREFKVLHANMRHVFNVGHVFTVNLRKFRPDPQHRYYTLGTTYLYNKLKIGGIINNNL